ncbi:DUF1735 domain-containing protein [Mucilaginibacter sp. AW1-7]|jgi:hypothetical protein|uniref:DUF1735 domain-containing protein n=1 Tax=unclassified Mucilaginibacter TaxID=2617802 RepID=UPI0008B03204|nr:DUF1735 domain-containing protein [Mucilaginibacter sp. OK283]SEO41857.1 protein of unknown function [Mucilaginibacter sp. OK283]
MKRNKFLNHILLACSVLVMFSACRKVPAGDLSNENPTAGTSYIGIPTGMENSNFFDPFTDIKTVNVFTVKKDAANNTDLKKPEKIVLTALPDAITKYNEKNGKSVELLPQSFYTLGTGADITQASSGNLTFAFASGDFSKDFIIKLNGSKLDLSKTYALAYKITSTDGLAIHAASKDTMYAFFSVKNKWDGVYQVTSGTMVDKTNAAFTHPNNWLAVYGISDNGSPTNGPMEYELRTISATQCVLYDNYIFGTVATPITTGTASDNISYYGSFGLILTFDPATNKVVSVTNYYGQPAGNTRYAQLDPSGANVYDPSSKTVTIKYNMCQPSVIADPPFVRTTWDEVWTYKGARE